MQALVITETASNLGEHAKKKMSQIVEKVHKGGLGVSVKIKIVYISNVE